MDYFKRETKSEYYNTISRYDRSNTTFKGRLKVTLEMELRMLNDGNRSVKRVRRRLSLRPHEPGTPPGSCKASWHTMAPNA